MRYLCCIGFCVLMVAASCRRAIPYWVRIVDSETGRGVPLVELRTPNAVLVCGWKVNTDWIGADEERELIARRLMKKEEALFPLLDPDSGAETGASPSSVEWNDYRKKWVMLAEKTGTVYYSEADQPIGPWRRAKKILTHKAYNFYNVVQHPFFDQEGGRIIYFEGTYTSSFSEAKQDTPRYNYNQIMYRLRLDDPRLRTSSAHQ